METITTSITLGALTDMASGRFGNLVKAVVDLERGVMVVDADMHADEEALLLLSGSTQDHLWGINLYPADFGSDAFLEFDSVINIRPGQGNRSRSVENATTRAAITALVGRLVTP